MQFAFCRRVLYRGGGTDTVADFCEHFNTHIAKCMTCIFCSTTNLKEYIYFFVFEGLLRWRKCSEEKQRKINNVDGRIIAHFLR